MYLVLANNSYFSQQDWADGGREGSVVCPWTGSAHMRAANTYSEWEAQTPTNGDVCVFQVAGVISAGVVMIAIAALGEGWTPAEGTILAATLIAFSYFPFTALLPKK